MGGMFAFVGKNVRIFGVNTVLVTVVISWCCVLNRLISAVCQFALKKGQSSVAICCKVVCCNLSWVETSGPHLCPSRQLRKSPSVPL